MEDIYLPYGDQDLILNLNRDEISEIIKPNNIAGVKDLNGEINNSLNNPIGSGDIREIVHDRAKNKGLKPSELDIVIISDDNTRLTPVDKILPFLITDFKSAGINNEQIKIIMALGTHRKMSEEEMINKVGADIFNNFQVLNHEFNNPDELVDMGVTENGTPIQINRHVYNADLAVGLGSIVPHHIPGFSGGAKIVQPGVCGSETTGYTHLLSVRKRKSFLGIMENPVRREMEEIARKVGVDYIFNVVFNREGNVYKTFFGDVEKAFRMGVKASREVYEVPVKNRTKVVLANSHPCDLEFWQAHKTLYPADIVADEGGMIILVSPCYEGVARTHQEMLDFSSLSYQEINEKVENNQIEDKVAAALAMAWARVTDHLEVVLVSEGINEEEAKALNFTFMNSLSDALDYARGKYKDEFMVNILTHAPDTLPVLNKK